MLARSFLALCAFGAVAVSFVVTASRHRPSSSFLDIVHKWPSRESSYQSPVLPVELPIKLGGHGSGTSLPVLVWPVPVYSKSEVNQQPYPPHKPVNYHPRTAYHRPVKVSHRRRPRKPYNQYHYPREGPYHPHYGPIKTTPEPRWSQEYNPNDVNPTFFGSDTRKISFTVYYKSSDLEPETYYEATSVQPVENVTLDDVQPSSEEPHIEDPEPVVEEDQIPYSKGRHVFDTTDDLTESYRRESPREPWLPAVMPRGRRLPARLPAPDPPGPAVPAPAPPRPRFARSLRMIIDLMVPQSGYTEVFDLEWHADSNTVRTVVEDGSTMFYRVPRLDGRVQFLKVLEDRMNGTVVRRCTTSSLLPATSADEEFPGLPDLSQFHFIGYTSVEGRSRVEVYRHEVIGAPGEGGAARGEALNFTHEFLLYRDGWNAVPLRYTVLTNSSVLGPATDYIHRYRLLPAPTAPIIPDLEDCHTVEEMKKDMRRGASGTIQNTTSSSNETSNLSRVEDQREARQITFGNINTVAPSGNEIFDSNEIQKDDKANQRDSGNGTVASMVKSFLNLEEVKKDQSSGAGNGDDSPEIASVERDFFHPLGDFLGLTRPMKYDTMFEDFKTKYNREYRDDREEAVRKAQFINNQRYVTAANRLSSTFLSEDNHLADRIGDEMKRLIGVLLPNLNETVLAPEFSLNDTKEIMKSEDWPEHFDWRESGYSTEVFHQGENCSSCWACAVAGATEGAYFKKTNKLVRLSPQSMLDCGTETNGCNPSDVTKGADYVKENGLSKWEDYPYKQKTGACKKPPNPPIVTRISGYRKVYESEEALRVAIRNYAPTVVIVPGLVKSFQLFKGDGIIDDERCSGEPNHAVLAVGWGTQDGRDYFIVKNSWGKAWGNGGYGKIAADSCAITKYGFYMVI